MVAIYLLALAALLAALLSLHRASTTRDWKPDFARQAYGEIDGDTLTLHDLRTTRYPEPGEPYEVRWDTRSYDLSELKRLWFLVESFSKLEVVAHTFLSFEFADGTCLAVSVEARPEVGENYDILDGVLRRFELSYIFGDERDMILRRTRYQQHQVYMYPLVTPPEEVRAVLLRMVETANDLKVKPRFYNSITDNCTSVLRKHANEVRPGSFGMFALAQVLPGTSDKMLYKKGWLATEVTLGALRERYAIKEKSEICAKKAEFSSCLRAELS